MSTAAWAWFQIWGDRPANTSTHRHERESGALESWADARVRCGTHRRPLADDQQHRDGENPVFPSHLHQADEGNSDERQYAA